MRLRVEVLEDAALEARIGKRHILGVVGAGIVYGRGAVELPYVPPGDLTLTLCGLVDFSTDLILRSCPPNTCLECIVHVAEINHLLDLREARKVRP